MTIDLIVFDLDGTLVDSRRDLADATNALILELGGTALSDDEVAAMVGEGAAVLIGRALAAAGLERIPRGALDRFLALYDERLTVHTRPYPGIPEALNILRQDGVTLAVLTNKPERPTRQILDRLDLARSFQHVVGGDTAAGRKPDPAGMSGIIDRAGASAGSTILVGDSPIDLQTARAAGTRVCLARYGFGYRFQPEAFIGDELFVDVPSELPRVLRGPSAW